MPTIRVRDEIYKELNRVAGELRHELGRPVSMDEVLEKLLRSRKLKPSDFQGAWKMTDKEAKELFKTLREHWSRWKYPSA
jgi:predicted CopG family antitoxin